MAGAICAIARVEGWKYGRTRRRGPDRVRPRHDGEDRPRCAKARRQEAAVHADADLRWRRGSGRNRVGAGRKTVDVELQRADEGRYQRGDLEENSLGRLDVPADDGV